VYLRVYLDTCAINRLTDDPSQMRIRLEADAMERFFRNVQSGKDFWISSSIVEYEIRRDPNPRRREDALAMLSYAKEFHLSNPTAVNRARFLKTVGYGAFDALRLAVAENSRVDLLLTTDDRFLRQAGRGLGKPSVRVANPLDYAQEAKP
jgi:hypothetical protein